MQPTTFPNSVSDNDRSRCNKRTRSIAITLLLQAHGSSYVHRERQASIIKSFEQAGISLPADGSQDHRPNIRCVADFKIQELDSTEEEDTLEFDTAMHAVDAATGRSAFLRSNQHLQYNWSANLTKLTGCACIRKRIRDPPIYAAIVSQ